MITVRPAKERSEEPEGWLTIELRGLTDTPVSGAEAFELFREGRIPPYLGRRHPLQAAEIITYVRAGTLVYQDSVGRLGVLSAGEFQRTTASGGIRYSEMNASPTDWAHVFQILLRHSPAELEAGHEQKRFSVAERRKALRVVASPDGRLGSLRIHRDILLYSAILACGQHVIHELSPPRSAWLYVIEGALIFGEVKLSTGDCAAITAERAVSLTARSDAEVLLLDLGQ